MIIDNSFLYIIYLLNTVRFWVWVRDGYANNYNQIWNKKNYPTVTYNRKILEI